MLKPSGSMYLVGTVNVVRQTSGRADGILLTNGVSLSGLRTYLANSEAYYRSECGYKACRTIEAVCARCFGEGSYVDRKYKTHVCRDCPGREVLESTEPS